MRRIVLSARNPGPMTGDGNNTYLVVSGGAAVLVDAGVGHPQHVADIDRTLTAHDASLRAVLVTHDHLDHVSGAPMLAAAHPNAVLAKYPSRLAQPADALPWRHVHDGEEVAFGGVMMHVVHTPGHSPDHLAFWHAPSRALFTGDLVIAGGSVMIQASRGGNLAQYLRSLERLLEFEPQCLLPAHGPRVDDPRSLVRGYIAHRLERERQVLAALGAGHRTVEAIAESIYDGLDPRLMAAARETVRAHLEKLVAEGIVADEDGWRTV